MASNDTPDLAGLGGKEIGELASTMSSATETGLGLVSTLTNITNLLDTIAKNPLLSVGTFRTIDHYLDKYLISRLKDAGVYTNKLGEAVTKTSRDMVIWTTTMSGVASALYSVGNAQAQVLKNTREISKFATMENLPGGATSLPGAAANLKYLEARMGMKYTTEFARNYVNQYTQLFSQLQKGTDIKALQDIIGLYSFQTGIDVAGVASNLLGNYRGLGLTGTGAIQAVIQPMMLQMSNRFAYGPIDQVMNTFFQMFQKQINLTGGDVGTAYQQSLALMKGLGQDFGLNEMLQLQNLYLGPGRTDEMIKRAALLPGVNFQQLQELQGGPGGLINTVAVLQQGVRNLVTQNASHLRGTDLQESLKGKTYTDIFTTVGGRKVFESFTQMFGISPELALSLARMKDINTNIRDIVNSMENLNISANKFIETVSGNETTKAIEKTTESSRRLTDIISNFFLEGRTRVGETMTELGLSPALVEGAGASLLIGTFLYGLLRKGKLYRGATKAPGTMGGAALPVIGGMNILREAHEGGDIGQGVMNTVTDVATFTLLSRMLGGGGGSTTAPRGGGFGRFAGRFGLPLVATGIVINELIKNLKPIEQSAVSSSLRIHGEGDEPLFMYNSRGEKVYTRGSITSENLEEVLNRGKIENTIENIAALSKRSMHEDLKRKAASTGVPGIMDKGDFGTLNIVITTADGETLAAETMERAETKRIMVNLKGVIG